MGEKYFSQMLSTHLDKFQTRQNSKWAKVTRIFKPFPNPYGRVKVWVEGVYILLTPSTHTQLKLESFSKLNLEVFILPRRLFGGGLVGSVTKKGLYSCQ